MAAPFSIAIYLYEPSDGGLDRVAILLANHLYERGVAVELWMARREGPLADLIHPNILIRLVPAPRWSRGLSMLAQWHVMRGMLHRYRPDILYSAGNQSNLLVACAALGMETRAIGRISNPIVRPDTRGLMAWLRKKRFQLTAWLSRMTIVMGEPDRALLAGRSIRLARTVMLLPRPTITPLLEQAGDRRSPTSMDHVRELLAVGRLTPQKDHRTTLAALALLSHRNWRLRIAGQGPLLPELVQQCADLGISDRVQFLGFVGDPADLAQLYAESDLLLQSSRWEGLAGTVIEALACGCGVVATRCSSNLERILADAQQQPMVPVGNVAAFAQALDCALCKPIDPRILQEAVKAYRIENAFDAHIDAFANIID